MVRLYGFVAYNWSMYSLTVVEDWNYPKNSDGKKHGTVQQNPTNGGLVNFILFIYFTLSKSLFTSTTRPLNFQWLPQNIQHKINDLD